MCMKIIFSHSIWQSFLKLVLGGLGHISLIIVLKTRMPAIVLWQIYVNKMLYFFVVFAYFIIWVAINFEEFVSGVYILVKVDWNPI